MGFFFGVLIIIIGNGWLAFFHFVLSNQSPSMCVLCMMYENACISHLNQFSTVINSRRLLFAWAMPVNNNEYLSGRKCFNFTFSVTCLWILNRPFFSRYNLIAVCFSAFIFFHSMNPNIGSTAGFTATVSVLIASELFHLRTLNAIACLMFGFYFNF